MNIAMSADGKIAFDNGHFEAFGSQEDRERLLVLRSEADAVMCGAGTVNDYPVNLGPGPKRFRQRRLRLGLNEYNLRVIISGSASLNPQAEIFRHRFSPIVVCVTTQATRTRCAALERAGAQIEVCGENEVDFVKALQRLRQHWGVRTLLCEGGGTVNDGMFRADLVDELNLTLCPWIFGGRLAPTLSDGLGHKLLAEANTFKLKSRRRMGDELFLVYQRKSGLRPGVTNPSTSHR
jgi:riboflavin-specific deaminase-like protein